MNKDQLEHWIKSERAIDLLHIDCALETELDSKTLAVFTNTLLLRAFPTTLEQDEAQFEKLKGNRSQRMYIKKMLLEYRILEKRILSAALDYAKQRTKV
ncbi:hypothetical protein DOY81_013906 [Sarcophaga bullata]|nr:hypothetical protein DOY81_013906 [Sarcophaga bullata]